MDEGGLLGETGLKGMGRVWGQGSDYWVILTRASQGRVEAHHGSHLVAFSEAEAEPSGHAKHAMLPANIAYEPALHGLQLVAAVSF